MARAALTAVAAASAFSAPRRGGALSSRSSSCRSLRFAPSGVDALPLVQQQLVFGAVFAGLGGGTAALTRVLDAANGAVPGFATLKKTWPLIGVVYLAAGAAHFGVEGAFLSIYPPDGTWGFWALPGSPEFHVRWTGVAEVCGGAGLVGGALGGAFGPAQIRPAAKRLAATSAAALALLTLAVTPANIYMYTHGALMVGAGPDGPLDVSFHYVRFVAQILLLSILTAIATESADSDETAI